MVTRVPTEQKLIIKLVTGDNDNSARNYESDRSDPFY